MQIGITFILNIKETTISKRLIKIIKRRIKQHLMIQQTRVMCLISSEYNVSNKTLLTFKLVVWRKFLWQRDNQVVSNCVRDTSL